MLDAAELAQALGDHESLTTAIQTYKTTMFARAETATRNANRSMNTMVALAAPAGVLDLFAEFMFGEQLA